MKKTLILLLALVFASGLLFAGGKQETAKSSGKIGGTVSVLTVWGGSELEIFNNMIKPFEERTGIKVEHQGTRDISAVLTTRLKAGNPPDIAGFPGPG